MYIASDAAGRTTKLHVSQLTREHLRKTMAFFLSMSEDQTPVPFQQVGTGTLNVLVLALLSFIAELKPASVAVQLALATESELVSELSQQLGLETGGPFTPICGWIVDTSIECDHQRFGGFLKISLEELLIALRDDRHLLHDPGGIFAPTARAAPAKPQSLYPQGFSAGRLIEVVETQAVWEGV